MKTLENLYQEIMENEEKKTAFAAALKENKIEDFLKANDCEGNVEDVMKFMKNKKEGELADDDLEKVAGGCMSSFTCNMTCMCTDGMYC